MQGHGLLHARQGVCLPREVPLGHRIRAGHLRAATRSVLFVDTVHGHIPGDALARGVAGPPECLDDALRLQGPSPRNGSGCCVQFALSSDERSGRIEDLRSIREGTLHLCIVLEPVPGHRDRCLEGAGPRLFVRRLRHLLSRTLPRIPGGVPGTQVFHPEERIRRNLFRRCRPPREEDIVIPFPERRGCGCHPRRGQRPFRGRDGVFGYDVPHGDARLVPSRFYR